MRCDLLWLLCWKITKRIHSSKPASLNCPVGYTLSSSVSDSQSVLFTHRSVLRQHFGMLKTQCYKALDHTKISLHIYIFVLSVINGMLNVGTRNAALTLRNWNVCMKFITLLINNVVYTSVLTLFPSDREPPPVMHCVSYFNFEDICEDLGKVQLPWCITENSATTIQLWELGWITFSCYTFSQFWQF